MDKRKVTANYLRSLAEAIECLTSDEFETVLRAGELKSLTASSGNKRGASKSSKYRPDLTQQASELLENLTRMESREQAHKYLDGMQSTRTVLIMTAKLRSIHVAREDTVSTLIDKLVSNIVGSRLDSAAIRHG